MVLDEAVDPPGELADDAALLLDDVELPGDDEDDEPLLDEGLLDNCPGFVTPCVPKRPIADSDI